VLTLVVCASLAVIGLEPVFDVPVLNVTVVAGQTALLPCSIEHLSKHKASIYKRRPHCCQHYVTEALIPEHKTEESGV
jgi:hypothetical protein